MAATIDIRLTNLQKLDEHKFNRMLEIVQEEISNAFPQAIVNVRKSHSMSDLSVFGLGKNAKEEVGEFLTNLFDDGSVFDELNEQYY